MPNGRKRAESRSQRFNPGLPCGWLNPITAFQGVPSRKRGQELQLVCHLGGWLQPRPKYELINALSHEPGDRVKTLWVPQHSSWYTQFSSFQQNKKKEKKKPQLKTILCSAQTAETLATSRHWGKTDYPRTYRVFVPFPRNFVLIQWHKAW